MKIEEKSTIAAAYGEVIVNHLKKGVYIMEKSIHLRNTELQMVFAPFCCC